MSATYYVEYSTHRIYSNWISFCELRKTCITLVRNFNIHSVHFFITFLEHVKLDFRGATLDATIFVYSIPKVSGR